MSLTLYPAIDLKDGACVRLVRGDMATATRFNDDPAAQAQRFIDDGARWIHVVDLNGAFAGRPVNARAVSAIQKRCRTAGVKLQLGGGIRDLGTVETWLAAGIDRVILGTLAVKQPELVRQACTLFPGRIAVGIDARDGQVAVEGWSESSAVGALDLALGFEGDGVSAIIFTDIARDGAMGGVNLDATAALAERLSTPVIASGGVRGLDDLLALAAAGISGAICGRALYDGALDLRSALARLAAPC